MRQSASHYAARQVTGLQADARPREHRGNTTAETRVQHGLLVLAAFLLLAQLSWLRLPTGAASLRRGDVQVFRNLIEC